MCLRTRLAVLALDGRAAPSSLLATEYDRQDETALAAATAYSAMTPTPVPGGPVATNRAPEIVDFTVVQIGPGQYRLTGRVIDENPGGLVVAFGGVPAAEGQSATTNAYGTFSLILTMQTDGSDTGLVTASTQDAAGQSSDVATYWVDPQ